MAIPNLWLHISRRDARNGFESYILWDRNSSHKFSTENIIKEDDVAVIIIL